MKRLTLGPTLAIVSIAAALALSGCSLNGSNYDGPTCKAHTQKCAEISSRQNGGAGAVWIPVWYWLALYNVQNRTYYTSMSSIGSSNSSSSSSSSLASASPNLLGKQPTSTEEEDLGATDSEASDQQADQQDYVDSASDETSEANDDAEAGDDPGGDSINSDSDDSGSDDSSDSGDDSSDDSGDDGGDDG